MGTPLVDAVMIGPHATSLAPFAANACTTVHVTPAAAITLSRCPASPSSACTTATHSIVDTGLRHSTADAGSSQDALAGQLLDTHLMNALLEALTTGPPVLRDTSGLFASSSRECKQALTLLQMTRFEQLCSVEQETCSVWLDQEHATVVGLRWPGGGRAFVCLTKHTEGDQRAYDSMGLGWMGRPATQRRDTVGYHLYVINDKKKPQSVFTLQMVESDRAMYSRHQERTAAGCQSLRALLRAVPVAKDQSGLGLGLRDDALALLLLSGARAAAGQLALDNASKEVTRKKLLALSKSLEDARTFDPWFNTTGKSVAGSIGNNVRLFAWTSTHVPSSADAAFAPSTDVAEGDGAAGSSKALGKRKAAKLAKEPTPVPTPATAQLVKAIDGFAPKSEAAARKPAFKMAKLMDPEPTGVDRHAAWGGDCGLFHAFSQDLFVSLLERCDCHTRLLLTEMVSKSFRMLRFEPELFASLTLNHCPSLKMSAQLWAAGRARAISCPAQVHACDPWPPPLSRPPHAPPSIVPAQLPTPDSPTRLPPLGVTWRRHARSTLPTFCRVGGRSWSTSASAAARRLSPRTRRASSSWAASCARSPSTASGRPTRSPSRPLARAAST